LRALLDEQVPVELADLIIRADPAHEVQTVTGMGWNGLKNGRLLREMRAAGFAALVTIDRRMEYQQTSRDPESDSWFSTPFEPASASWPRSLRRSRRPFTGCPQARSSICMRRLPPEHHRTNPFPSSKLVFPGGGTDVAA
jgi:hypothetical protein